MAKKGSKMSEEEKKNRSDAAKKRYIDRPEERQKISERNKVRWADPEEHAKLSAALKAHYKEHPESAMKIAKSNTGKKRTEEQKARMSKVQKLKWEDPEHRKRNSEIQKRVHGTPEARAATSERMKKLHQEHPEKFGGASERMKQRWAEHPEMFEKSEETRKKMSEARKGVKFSPETVERIRASHQTPEYRAKASARKKKQYAESPELREKASRASRARFERPEEREWLANMQKKRWERPGEKEKQSARCKAFYATEESRKALSERAKQTYVDNPGLLELRRVCKISYHEDHRWYGSVKYNEGPQYCEKWTKELRERVRAHQNYTCICGKTTEENGGRALAVHHVWYNIRLCCDDTPRSLVALCTKCHGKTNTVNKAKRAEYSKYYQNIVDNEFDGKCWLTREEYAAYRGA